MKFCGIDLLCFFRSDSEISEGFRVVSGDIKSLSLC